MVYNALRIVNTINAVLLLSVFLSLMNFNKYISFIILLIFSGSAVIISKYIFNYVFKFDNTNNIESTQVYKILSILSIIGLLLYLALNSEWLLILIMVIFVGLFFVFVHYISEEII